MEICNTFEVSSTYSVIEQTNGIALSMRVKSHKMLTSQKYVLFVLDVSGSMCSYGKIDACKQTLIELYKYCHDVLDNKNVDILIFREQPTLIELSNLSVEQATRKVNEIYADGCEYYVPMFNKLMPLLDSKKAQFQDLCLMFLADGQAVAETPQMIQPYIDNLKIYLPGNFLTAEVHTLGYGQDHDASLLSELTKCSTGQGTFQYVRNTQDIKQCLESISGSIGEKSFKAELVVDGAETKVHFRKKAEEKGLETTGNDNIWKCVHVFDNTDEEAFNKMKDKLSLKLTLDTTETHQLDPKVGDELSRAEQMECLFIHINSKLKSLGEVLLERKSNLDEISKLNEQISTLRVTLTSSLKDLYKIPIANREPLRQSFEDLQEYAGTLIEIVKKAANSQLGNEQIATINSLAYRHIAKDNLLKKLDKRSVKNAGMINEIFENVKNMKVEGGVDLNEKYKELIPQYGNCFMTLYDFVEAIQNNDCLCITFDIVRPEMTIADASRLVIKKINPTLIAASAFFDVVKYSMSLNIDNSGGFNGQAAGKIAVGASGETITAAMPIFIAPEHWKVASELIKPMLGWVVTTNTLGYEASQLKTVPFMLLAEAFEKKQSDPKSEFNERMYQALLDTCYHLINDDISFLSHLRKTWTHYLKDGTLRTVTSIINNKVFLAQVYVMIEKGLLEKPEKDFSMEVFKRMVEEDMRRKQNKASIWNSGNVRKQICKLLGVDSKEESAKLQAELGDIQIGNKATTKKEEEKKTEAPNQKMEVEEEKKIDQEKKVQKTKKSTAAKKEFAYNAEDFPTLGEAVGAPKKVPMKVEPPREEEVTHEEEIEEEDRTRTRRGGFGRMRGRLAPRPQREPTKKKNVQELPPIPKEAERFLQASAEKIVKDMKFDETDKTQTAGQKEFFSDFQRSVKSLRFWFAALLAEEFTKTLMIMVEDFGIVNHIQLITCYIQNKMHAKNDDRNLAFTEKTYIDIWNVDECIKFLTTKYQQIVWETYINTTQKKNQEPSIKIDDLRKFAMTDDLQQAAKILTKPFDLRSCQTLLGIFRKEAASCKLVLEKLMMIRNREYGRMKLNVDVKMLKKYIRQLYTKYRDQYKYEEWKELWFKQKKSVKNGAEKEEVAARGGRVMPRRRGGMMSRGGRGRGGAKE